MIVASPTTAIEVEMMMEVWRRDNARMAEIIQNLYRPFWDRMIGLLIPKRPYTDDMMQMCVDLGIEVPDRYFPHTLEFR